MSGICSRHQHHEPTCHMCCAWPKLDQAKEPLDGSPLESVVQGRTESPVPSNPAVQGTPDILAELRDRAVANIEDAQTIADGLSAMDHKKLAEWHAVVWAFKCVLRWIDELAQPKDNTAPDTTSGSAGVP